VTSYWGPWLKSANLLRIALGLIALATAWVGFQLATHRHTGILRIMVETKHFIEGKRFITGTSTSSTAQSANTKFPPGPQHRVNLSWKASTSVVVGYNVYRRGGTSGQIRLNFLPVNATSYVDSTVSPGLTYFYVIKAVNGRGGESTPSNEIRADVPTP
jgi:fibronectin type 3 domain-containing protein